MGFKVTYECEHCGQDIQLLTTEEVPEMCPACEDTGDSRPNVEKYECAKCWHWLGGEDCSLSPVFIIKDIHCPLKEGK